MSFLADTPIYDSTVQTDLARALPRSSALASVERDWLNLLRRRANRRDDPYLLSCTDNMLRLLKEKPEPAWENGFLRLYEDARERGGFSQHLKSGFGCAPSFILVMVSRPLPFRFKS